MKHQDILARMRVEEKAAILSGASEWTSRSYEHLGIPSVSFADGPHGIRKQEGEGDHLGLNGSLPATCFPTAAAVANSWDESLGEEVGKALGKEAKAQGVDVLLGPGLNIKRSPLCGRNFEYFSEDPYLSGKMAAAYVRGIQSQGVRSCIKHFAVNSQELRRMAMNAVVDERTLREIYLTGFEIAIKEGGAKAVMTSYNEVNGVYANENEHLLQDILRKEWGFDGLVVTDWGASNDHVRAVKCRSNLEMPKSGLDPARELLAALEKGRLTIEELDACVDDLLDAALEGKEKRKGTTPAVGEFDWEGHHKLAGRAARESIVLLKNEEAESRLLPLRKSCKVALVGGFAKKPRYQGAGSSMVRETALECMTDMVGRYPLQCVGYAQGYLRMGGVDQALKKEALELAKQAEVVLYCFGLDETSESEGVDREHMRIPQCQIDLLEDLAGVNRNIVGILSAGSPVEMPWQHLCRAILYGALSGQAGAGAMLDVITGAYNPSGKLAESYPVSYENTPAYRYYPAVQRSSQYREGLYVGYRYYETAGVKVQYPFGYGLSYTEFTYSDLRVEENGVSFTVKNTGAMDGTEVAQLYVGGPGENVFRPDKELKGFAKVFIPAGESRQVRIPFDDKTFRYWNVMTGRFEVAGGCYRLLVGACVKDIRLQGHCYRKETTREYPYDRNKLPMYRVGLVHNISDEEYETLLGHPLNQREWSGKLTKNDAVCQMYYAKSGVARLIYRWLARQIKKKEEQGKTDLNLFFIYNMPFRAVAKMTHGAVGMKMVDGIVLAVNGHFFQGAGKVLSGFFENWRANRTYEKCLAKIARRGKVE